MIDRKHFKTQFNYDGFSEMHPQAQEVAAFAIEEAIDLGVELPMITETKTTFEMDKALGRVSISHSDGRAFDFRTWNLLPYQLIELTRRLIAKYGHLGAINKLGHRQLVVHHDIGKGDHLHIQLDGRFKA